MGRAALEEDNTENYRFFQIISTHMVDMEKVPENKRSEEARSRIIGNISADERKFSRVSLQKI